MEIDTSYQETQLSQDPQDYVIEQIMAARQHDELLHVLTQDMDPLDIDICVLARRCTQLLEAFDKRNLTTPAHMVVASAVILNMKTQLWLGDNSDEREDVAASVEEDLAFAADDMALSGEDAVEVADETHIPALSLPIRRMPTSRVTIDDLYAALQRTYVLHTYRQERQQQRSQVPVTISEEDIEQRMQRLFTILRRRVGQDNNVRFEDILEREDVREKVEKFVHLLHLEGDEKVRCVQEEFLGDLIVRLLEKEKRDEDE